MSTAEREERRAEPRSLCHQHCIVRFDRMHLDGVPGSVGVEGYICDLSPGGVGLLMQPAIPAGATLAIAPIEVAAGPLPPSQVIHCIAVGQRWRHGCRLERRLSQEELRYWLE
jgi:hypothetical protein